MMIFRCCWTSTWPATTAAVASRKPRTTRPCKPALTLTHSSGLYLGAWSSNVDFGGGLKTRQEIDYYAGWLWQATDEVNLDLGYLKYATRKKASSIRARSTAFSAFMG